MCTVTFISAGNQIFLTSNRDEHLSRPTATPPIEKIFNDCKLIFPQDLKANGSWFAVNEFGATAVLLNGAFENHSKTENYIRSRGLVLLDLICNNNMISKFNEMGLENIEPFTVIYYKKLQLIEFRWDGQKKHAKVLETNENHIWSSVTMYDDEMVQKKENQFKRFLGKKIINETSIFNFHANNENDFENDFVINRPDGMKTFSVTQSIYSGKTISFLHKDLQEDKVYSKTIVPNNFINCLA